LVTNDNEPHEAFVLATLAQAAPRRSPWRTVDLIADTELARSVLAAHPAPHRRLPAVASAGGDAVDQRI
jgi:hypothetical protein